MCDAGSKILRLSLLLFASMCFGGFAEALTWQPIGPNGGDQFQVVISPVDPDTLFALSHYAVHRSPDGGSHWQAIQTSEMQNSTHLALVFDPQDPNHIYMASTTCGVWESHDKGDNWVQCSLGLPRLVGDEGAYFAVASLAFDSNGQLFAGLGQIDNFSQIGAYSPNSWVYKLDAGSKTWLPEGTGIELATTPLTQNVNTFLQTDNSGKLWAMVYGAGVFVYQNGSWDSKNGDLPNEALFCTYLQIDPSDSSRLLLGTEYDWIFESTNGGQNWTLFPLPPALSGLDVLPLVYAIAVDPNNSEVIYVSAMDAEGSTEQPLFHPEPGYQSEGGGSYLSFNGGIDWIDVPISFFRLTFDSLTTVTDITASYGPLKRSKVWYRTSGGHQSIFKSIDGGLTYQPIIEGIENVVVNSIWLHPTPPDPHSRMLFVAEEGFLHRASDNSENWEYNRPIQDCLYSWSFAANYSDPTTIYYSTGQPAWSYPEQMGIYRLDLDCFGLECLPSEQLLNDVGVWRIITTPAQPMTIYAATQEHGIWVSYNGGSSWGSFNNSVAELAGSVPGNLIFPQSITDIVLDDSGNPLYASSRTSSGNVSAEPPQYWWLFPDEAGAIYRYNSENAVWNRLPGVTSATLDIERSPVDQQTLFAATAQGIFMTTNGGETWENVLPQVLVYDLAINSTNPNCVYAATNIGVWRSTDGGHHWHDISEGLRVRAVFSLAFDQHTGILYAGTAGNSAFKLVPDANPVPILTIGPTSLNWGIVPVGLSADKGLVLSNEGEADLVIDSIDCADPEVFSILDFSPPLTITPGNQAVLAVRFSPQVVGSIESSLTFNSNDPVNPAHVIALSGGAREAVEPMPDVKINGEDNPPPIPYGKAITISGSLSAGDYLGQQGDFWVRVTLSDNTTYWLVEGGLQASSEPLLLSTGPIVNLLEAVNFTLNSCPSGVSEVLFAADPADGVFQGTWSDSVSFTVNLMPPGLVTSPEGLDFGVVSIGFPRTLGLAVANGGEAELVIDSIEFGSSEFSLLESPQLPWTIASGETIVLRVQFDPQALGVVESRLTFKSNDPVNQALVVDLTGEGREAVEPVPDIKANGGDDLLTLTRGDQLTVSISLRPESYLGVGADWWLLVLYFNQSIGSFVPVLAQNISQGPLDLLPSTDLISTPDLPVGVFIFGFGVDLNMNGAFDPDQLFLDLVPVFIMP